MKIIDNYLEFKSENLLELKEKFHKRTMLMVVLVLSGALFFYIVNSVKPSDDYESDMIAGYFLLCFGCILSSLGLFTFLGRTRIKIDKSKGMVVLSTSLRDLIFKPLEIKINEIRHIQIRTLSGGWGPDYDVVNIATYKKEITVYSGRNEFIINKLSSSISEYIGCKIFYNS
jgi:hypothetical protein